MLSNDQKAYWEALPQSFPMFLYIHSPDIVFTARVNQATFSYPVMQVAFDTVTTGAYTDIQEGMTVLFGSTPGGDDLGRVRARRDPISSAAATSSVLFFARVSLGVGDGEVQLGDNVYITVLNQYLIWAVPPYITDDGTIYKDGAVVFNNAYSQRPVANAGPDCLKIVQVGTTSADVYFGQTASHVNHPSASSISTYLWDFADGTPSTSSSAVPGDVSFPPGKRYVSLTVVDNIGGTHTAHALIVVAEKNDSDLIRLWDVESWTEKFDGQQLRIRVDEPLPFSEYPDGTEVLICTTEHAHQEGLLGREHMLFSGWLHDEMTQVEAREQGIISRLSFDLLDAMGRMRLLPSFPETVTRKTPATNWTEQQGANPDRFIHYRFDWHSTLLNRVDYFPSGEGENYAFRGLESSGRNLADEVDFIAQAIGYVTTCDIYNRIALKQDPQLAPTASQNSQLSIGFSRSTAVKLDLEAKHWSGYQYTHKRAARVHFNWGEALLRSTTDMESGTKLETVFVVAPGFAPSQGGNESNTTKQIVRNVNELRMRVGNIYRARQNPLYENFQFQVIPMRKGIHPADMQWLEMTLTGKQAGLRGREIANVKVLPFEVSYRVDVQNRLRIPTLSVEREVTNGTPAVQYTPKSEFDQNWMTNIPEIDLGNWVYTPSVASRIPENTGELPVRLTVSARQTSSQFGIGTSIDIGAGTITWTDVSTGLPASFAMHFTSDPWNYSRRLMCMGSDGVYQNSDPFALNSWSSWSTYLSIFGDASAVAHKIIGSINRKGYFGVVSGNNAYAFTTDNGASWTLVAPGGGSVSYGTSTAISASNFDVVASPYGGGRVYASRSTPYHGGGTPGGMEWCVSDDWGATWSQSNKLSFANGNITGTWKLHIPYKRPNGAPNTHVDGNQIIYASCASGTLGNLAISTNSGSSWTLLWSGAGNTVPSGSECANPITSFTHDGSLVRFTGHQGTNSTNQRICWMEDDVVPPAKIDIITAGSGTSMGSLNGFPTSTEFLWYFNQYHKAGRMTFDGGANYITSLPSFFGSVGISWAEGDLSQIVLPGV